MKKIILNQKSYLLYNDVVLFKHEIEKMCVENYEFILFPPIIYLTMFKDSKLTLGAQNFYSSKRGSFTGEINIEQLKDINVKYTMIAHHERKRLMSETSYDIKEKLFKSISSHMNTLLYIGEYTKSKYAFGSIKRDINLYLKGLNKSDLKYLNIVYDPNWVIGMSETKDISKIAKMIKRIKIYIKNIYGTDVEVYYGGVVNEDNINDILKISDGIVLGKISTDINKLRKLLEYIKE